MPDLPLWSVRATFVSTRTISPDDLVAIVLAAPSAIVSQDGEHSLQVLVDVHEETARSACEHVIALVGGILPDLAASDGAAVHS